MNSYTKKVKQEVINRYLNGENISFLAREKHISRTTIYAWIKEYNATFNKGKAPDFRYLHDLEQKCEKQKQVIEILKISSCTPDSPLSQKYEAIKSLSDKYSINLLCEALKVPKGSYYNHILRNKNGNTLFSKKRAEMTPIIIKIFHQYNEIFGSEKIHAILKEQGYSIAESTVADIMHENNLFSVRTGAKKLFEQQRKRKENLLQQQFKVSRPNEVWCSDVTLFTPCEKTYYICAILDLYARKVIAYKIAENNSTQLIKATLKMAYNLRKPTENLMFHSDQGSNYSSRSFMKYVKDLGITQSFSKVRYPYDNSVMESFFNNLKRESLYRYKNRSEKEFIRNVDNYMKFYNEKRPHTFLMNQTPDNFEANYYKRKIKSKIQTEQQ